MQTNQPTDVVQRSGVATYIVEAVVAFCVLALGVVVIQGSWWLGSGWTSDGPGAGYFPFWIGVILCISGAGIFYQALFGKTRNMDIFVDSVQLKRVLSVLLPAIVYVGVVQLIGLYLASVIYIAVFMIVLGKYPVLKSTIVSLAVIVLFFFMFEVWFKVPLFKGQFNALSFIGY